ncbi:hypothetical protein MN608_04655 [Microdochium nivale]|nr:hypothetical protein MN608_04655 [Microdochium nivale]
MMSAPTAALEVASFSAAATTALTAVTTAVAAAILSSSTTIIPPPASSITMGDEAGPTSLAVGGSDDGECRLLGPFALIIQMALGGLALLALVYKRYRERPQRPVKIWFFDVSKQLVGSVLVHIANVFMSMLTSGRFSVKVAPVTVQTAAAMLLRRAAEATGDDTYTPNPCSFYLLNLAIDTTLGIPILLILLKITTGLIAHTPLGKPAESIQSGHYGSPPRASWWLKQSFIYFCGLFGMKICVLLIFLILPWIARIGDWALGWTEGNERLQIVFVMMLFPLIMNILQYYIIDNFIMEKDHDGAASAAHRPLRGDEHDDDPFNNSLADSGDETNGRDNDDHDDDMESGSDHGSSSSVKMSRSKSSLLKTKGKNKSQQQTVRDEYDPDLDGQTVVGSSHSREAKLQKGLLPHE